MCLACEQDAIWFAYLESRGLLKPDDPAALDALFGAFPVQPLPMRGVEGERAASSPAASAASPDRNSKPAENPFSCDDPTTVK